jgi:aryl-phospho-beta-D-glucosidase BglC (GH1 family)
MELADLVTCYNETLTSTLDRHAPIITKTIVKRPIVPWFTDEVKPVKRQQRIAEKKWRLTKLQCDFLHYKAKRNYATFVMKTFVIFILTL